MAEPGDSMKEQLPQEVRSAFRREVLQKGWHAVKNVLANPVKKSLGLGNPYPSDEQLSRREFIKGGAAIAGTVAALGGGVLAAGSAISRAYKESPQGRAQYDAYPKPEGLPEDILTKEELQKAGITVYQTEDTQLYLRRGIFDFPLFRDAREKRIKGVVIALVDSDSISWNSTSQLPMDARAVWQGRILHPSEYSEANWDELKKYTQDMIDYHQKRLDLTQEINSLQELTFRDMIKYGEIVLKTSTEEELPEDVLEQARKIVNDATDALQDFLSDEKQKVYREMVLSEERRINEFKNELEIFQDRP